MRSYIMNLVVLAFAASVVSPVLSAPVGPVPVRPDSSSPRPDRPSLALSIPSAHAVQNSPSRSNEHTPNSDSSGSFGQFIGSGRDTPPTSPDSDATLVSPEDHIPNPASASGIHHSVSTTSPTDSDSDVFLSPTAASPQDGTNGSVGPPPSPAPAHAPAPTPDHGIITSLSLG